MDSQREDILAWTWEFGCEGGDLIKSLLNPFASFQVRFLLTTACTAADAAAYGSLSDRFAGSFEIDLEFWLCPNFIT